MPLDRPRSSHPLDRRRFLTFAALGLPTVVAACAKPPTEIVATTHRQAPPSPAAPPTQSAPTPLRQWDRAPSRWGTDLPGVQTLVPTASGKHTMALTFDICGGPGGSALDRKLIATLREFAVPATLFLNERWLHTNPHEAAELREDPLFRIENHGSLHVPLSVTGRPAYGIAGTSAPSAVVHEISSNRQLLSNTLGVDSRWFRAGTAHYDDVAIAIAHDLGVRIAGFAVNADSGATASAGAVSRQLQTAPDGAIVLAHANQPHSATAEGVRSALSVLTFDGCRFVHLDGTGAI
ncbi:polysaccharide deacetylase family protein [Rhodococcus qingshengii]